MSRVLLLLVAVAGVCAAQCVPLCVSTTTVTLNTSVGYEPLAQTLSITTTQSGTVGFGIGVGAYSGQGNWLDSSLSCKGCTGTNGSEGGSGTVTASSPTTMTISAANAVTTFPPGSSKVTLTFTCSSNCGTNGSFQAQVSVTLNVTSLIVSAAPLVFAALEGSPSPSAAQDPQLLTVNATTTIGFSVAIEAGPAGYPGVAYCGTGQTNFTSQTATQWLSAPANATAPQNLPLSVQPQGLSPGIYVDFLNLVPSGNSPPAPVTAYLLVESTPQATFNFSYTSGGMMPATQNTVFTSQCGVASSSIEVGASSDQNWLTVATNGEGNSVSITIRANPSPSMAPGEYYGTVAITDDQGEAWVALCTLTVSAPANLTSTTTQLVVSPTPAASGQQVALTANVSPPTATGPVTFYTASKPVATVELANGAASTTQAVTAAVNTTLSIYASYGGDLNDDPSTSPTLDLAITAAGANVVLPQFAAGNVWTTGIFAINTGMQPANFQVNFLDGGQGPLPFTIGSAPTSTLAGTIPALGLGYFEAGNPNQLNPLSGWAQTQAGTGVTIQALFREQNGSAYYEAAVPQIDGSYEFRIPFDATTFTPINAQFYTGLAIANLDPNNAANINCTARNTQGAVISGAFTSGGDAPPGALPAYGHYLGYNFLGLAGQRGTIDCTSNTAMAATALRFIGTGGAFSSLPVVTTLPANNPQTSSIAHFAAAGGVWTTGIFVLNTGSLPANFQIAFHDANGNLTSLPFSTGTASTLSGTLPSGGLGYYEASSSDPNADLVYGSGLITADPAIVVQALFREDAGNGNYYEAAVPEYAGSKEFVIPFDATTFAPLSAQFYTGLAIANLDPKNPANINCTALNDQGVAITGAFTGGDPAPGTLNPLGHYQGYNFPALVGQRGTIDCKSDTTIAAIALRFIGSGGAFSSLPVIYK